MRANCYKCKGSFQREMLWEIHLTLNTNCFLCPRCGEVWTRTFNKWKSRKLRIYDFWNKAWNDFIYPKKFNPSLRGSI